MPDTHFTRQFPADMLREIFCHATRQSEEQVFWHPRDRPQHIARQDQENLDIKQNLTKSSRLFRDIVKEFRWEAVRIRVQDNKGAVKYLDQEIRRWLQDIFPKTTHVILCLCFDHVTPALFDFFIGLLCRCRRLEHASLLIRRVWDYIADTVTLPWIQDIISVLPVNLRTLNWDCTLTPRQDGEIFHAIRRFTMLRTLIIHLDTWRTQANEIHAETLASMLNGGTIHLPHLEYLRFIGGQLPVIHPNAVWELPQLLHLNTVIDSRLFIQPGLSFNSVTHVTFSRHIVTLSDMFRNSVASVFPSLQHLAYTLQVEPPFIFDYRRWHWMSREIPDSLTSITIKVISDSHQIDEGLIVSHLRIIPFKHAVTIRLGESSTSHGTEELRRFAERRGHTFEEVVDG